MDLEQYRQKREQLHLAQKVYRELCTCCMQPQFGCYCAQIRRFDPLVKFVVLIHPIEVKRRIATGRMSHLILDRSELIQGQNYSENSRVNEITQNPNFHSVVLYPGVQAVDLTQLEVSEKSKLVPFDKELVVFVIDGTWATARRMIRQSENLKRLPRICFTPSKPSNFRVRKQPKENCFSTIEAIHQTIELLGPFVGFDLQSRTHDHLLDVFDDMVERQLSFIREAIRNPREGSYRRQVIKEIES